MSKKVVTCPGSGRASGSVSLGKNPKVNCPDCDKRIGVMHTGKIRKHTALRRVK